MEQVGDEEERDKEEAGGGGGGPQGTWDSWTAGPRRREPQAAKPDVPRVDVWKRQGPRPHRRDLLTRAPEGAGGRQLAPVRGLSPCVNAGFTGGT